MSEGLTQTLLVSTHDMRLVERCSPGRSSWTTAGSWRTASPARSWATTSSWRPTGSSARSGGRGQGFRARGLDPRRSSPGSPVTGSRHERWSSSEPLSVREPDRTSERAEAELAAARGACLPLLDAARACRLPQAASESSVTQAATRVNASGAEARYPTAAAVAPTTIGVSQSTTWVPPFSVIVAAALSAPPRRRAMTGPWPARRHVPRRRG